MIVDMFHHGFVWSLLSTTSSSCAAINRLAAAAGDPEWRCTCSTLMSLNRVIITSSPSSKPSSSPMLSNTSLIVWSLLVCTQLHLQTHRRNIIHKLVTNKEDDACPEGPCPRDDLLHSNGRKRLWETFPSGDRGGRRRGWKRSPAMKPQSAFDRAAPGCGSPSSPSSYGNNDYQQSEIWVLMSFAKKNDVNPGSWSGRRLPSIPQTPAPW